MSLIRNSKGLSMVELLAAIAITGFVLTVVIYFTRVTTGSIDDITGRETALKESRLVLNHIVREVKNGRVTASVTSPGYVLSLDGYENKLVNNVKTPESTGNYTRYQFNASTNSVVYFKKTGASLQSYTLSKHVTNLTVTLSGEKLDISITVKLPNNQTEQIQTSVYLSRLK